MLDALESVFRSSYNAEEWRQTTLYPGVLERLHHLVAAGLACHVLTNKPQIPTRRILHYLLIHDYFTEIITPDSRQPPFASKLAAALAVKLRLGLDGGEAMVVGDGHDDALAAEGCGFDFIAAKYGYGGINGVACPNKFPGLSRFSQLVELLETHKCSACN